MNINISNHARARMEQRSIPLGVVDLILNFGNIEYHKGREIYRLDRKSIKKIRRYYGSFVDGRFAEKLLGHYLVAENDTLVTVAHITKKIKTKRR